MNRKKYILFTFLLLVIGLNLYIYFAHFKAKKDNVSAFSTVSERTTAFIYTNNLDSLANKIDSLEYLTNLEESIALSQLINQIQFTDSIIKLSKTELPKDLNRSLFALNNSGSSNLSITTSLEFKSAIKTSTIKKFFKSQGYKISEYKFQDYKIYSLENFFENKSYSFSIYSNLLIGSESSPLIEEALSNITKENTKTNSEAFQELISKSNSNADLNLFIDHKNTKDLEGILMSSEFINETSASESFATWSLYDVSLNDKNIDFKTHYSNLTSSAMKTLLKSDYSEFSLDNFLPNNTAYFEAICSKNNLSFQNNDISYSYFSDWLSEEAAFFVLETFDEDYMKRSGLVLKANNIDSAKVNLYLLNKEMSPVQSFDGVAIYEMNVDVLGKIVKSNLFEFQNPFFAFIDSYVVFANDANVLRICIQKFQSKSVLKTKENYKTDSINTSNKLVYFNPQKCRSAINGIFKEKGFPNGIGKTNINYFTKDGSIVSKGTIRMDQEIEKRTQSLWNVVLDTVSYFKPQIVINENNQRKEIITQDENNTIYLISQAGDVVLKKAFDEKIEGDIYQIDLYKANRLFYVFNTKKYIYALKRNGSIVDGYPIKLPTEASNSIKVVNYDKAKKYRFFIACENQKVYGYEANGKPLEGWSPLGNFGNINTPIKYTVFDGRDYIYFNNEEGTFYAFNRKGEPRFDAVNLSTPFKNSFERTKKGFVNMSKGSVFKIDFKGKASAKIVADTSYVNFSNYEEKEAYAFANDSEFRIAKSKWTILGKKKLNDRILGVNKIRSQDKTWFLVHCSKSIYLINELGEIHPDFPMLSDSEARISNFYSVKNDILILNEGGQLKAFELIIPN